MTRFESPRVDTTPEPSPPQVGPTLTYEVCVKGTYQADDGCEIDMGPLGDRAWWEVPLPPCPDCGGEVVWREAGHAPGTRRCVRIDSEDGRSQYDTEGGCGSMCSVQTKGGRCVLRRAWFYQTEALNETSQPGFGAHKEPRRHRGHRPTGPMSHRLMSRYSTPTSMPPADDAEPAKQGPDYEGGGLG